jgi:hypothetical protein
MRDKEDEEIYREKRMTRSNLSFDANIKLFDTMHILFSLIIIIMMMMMINNIIKCHRC